MILMNVLFQRRIRSVGESQAGPVRHRGHAAQREGRGPSGGGDHDNCGGVMPSNTAVHRRNAFKFELREINCFYFEIYISIHYYVFIYAPVCQFKNLNVISKLVIGIFIVFAIFENIYPTLNPVSD